MCSVSMTPPTSGARLAGAQHVIGQTLRLTRARRKASVARFAPVATELSSLGISRRRGARPRFREGRLERAPAGILSEARTGHRIHERIDPTRYGLS
jgi:hypothetical protein